MHLHVLGSAGSYPAPGRPASGFLIEQGATRVWCEAGPGTFMALGATLDLDLVTAVVLSHRHADHCADLLAASHYWAYRASPRRGLPLLAPRSVIDQIVAFLDADDDHPFFQVFTPDPVEDGHHREIGELEVEFFTTSHTVPTVGSRWTDGSRVLAYSADTGAEGDWPRLAHDADLFLCEASHQETTSRLHLSAGQAGAIARGQGVRRLMLTHIPPHLDPLRSLELAEADFGREVAAAIPGTRHKV